MRGGKKKALFFFGLFQTVLKKKERGKGLLASAFLRASVARQQRGLSQSTSDTVPQGGAGKDGGRFLGPIATRE